MHEARIPSGDIGASRYRSEQMNVRDAIYACLPPRLTVFKEPFCAEVLFPEISSDRNLADWYDRMCEEVFS
jgi:hypothetical protein